jgi:hypothetical protein
MFGSLRPSSTPAHPDAKQPSSPHPLSTTHPQLLLQAPKMGNGSQMRPVDEILRGGRGLLTTQQAQEEPAAMGALDGYKFGLANDQVRGRVCVCVCMYLCVCVHVSVYVCDWFVSCFACPVGVCECV